MPLNLDTLQNARDAGMNDDEIWQRMSAADPRYDNARQAGHSLDDVAAKMTPIPQMLLHNLKQAGSGVVKGAESGLESLPFVGSAIEALKGKNPYSSDQQGYGGEGMGRLAGDIGGAAALPAAGLGTVAKFTGLQGLMNTPIVGGKSLQDIATIGGKSIENNAYPDPQHQSVALNFAELLPKTLAGAAVEAAPSLLAGKGAGVAEPVENGVQKIPMEQSGQALAEKINKGLGTSAEMPASSGKGKMQDFLQNIKDETGKRVGAAIDMADAKFKTLPPEHQQAVMDLISKKINDSAVESGLLGMDEDGNLKVKGSVDEVKAKKLINLAQDITDSKSLGEVQNTLQQVNKGTKFDKGDPIGKLAGGALSKGLEEAIQQVGGDENPEIYQAFKSAKKDYENSALLGDVMKGSFSKQMLSPEKFTAAFQEGMKPSKMARLRPELEQGLQELTTGPEANPLGEGIKKLASFLPGANKIQAMGDMIGQYLPEKQGPKGNFFEPKPPSQLEALKYLLPGTQAIQQGVQQ